MHASCFNMTRPQICSYQHWIILTLALQLMMTHL
jgi:hypothetical protein